MHTGGLEAGMARRLGWRAARRTILWLFRRVTKYRRAGAPILTNSGAQIRLGTVARLTCGHKLEMSPQQIADEVGLTNRAILPKPDEIRLHRSYLTWRSRRWGGHVDHHRLPRGHSEVTTRS